MAKYVSSGNTQEDIKHYQKLLIPLNIVVCVMCIVSIFTLMFAPILRIDVAKIVSSKEVSSYVKETVVKSLNGGNNNQGSVSADGNWVFTTATAAQPSGNNSNSGSSSNEGISDEMISAISTSVVDPLLQSIGKSDISLNFTAFSSLKVLTGGSDALKSELSEMVGKFADGLIEAINNLFRDGAIVNTIVDVSLPTIINTSIDALKNDPETPQDVVDLLNNLTKNDIDKLCDDLKGLKTTKTPQQFIDKIVEIAPNLMLTLTGQDLDNDQISALREEITKMVNETVEKVHAQNPNKQFDYNLEAFLCIQLSQNIDIAELDKLIEDMIKGENNSNDNGSSIAYAMDSKVDDKTDGKDNNDSSGSTSDGNTSDEKTYTIYTSFSEILGAMENTQSNMGEAIRAAVNNALDELGESIDSFATIYGFLFIFVAVFMVLWFILFLFSLLHIFAKNKRFMMWYVKLLCWIPGIIWLVLTLASMPAVMTSLVGMVSAEIPVSVITAVFRGISSWGTGVSYICYWLLWIISIFWAFPIKHKIRKLKKQAKREQKEQQVQN